MFRTFGSKGGEPLLIPQIASQFILLSAGKFNWFSDIDRLDTKIRPRSRPTGRLSHKLLWWTL